MTVGLALKLDACWRTFRLAYYHTEIHKTWGMQGTYHGSLNIMLYLLPDDCISISNGISATPSRYTQVLASRSCIWLV